MEVGITDRAAVHLRRYTVDGNRLVLEMSLPGVTDSEVLAEKFGVPFLPVRTVSVAAPKALGEVLEVFAAEDLASRVVRVWSHGHLGELVFLGNEEATLSVRDRGLKKRRGHVDQLCLGLIEFDADLMGARCLVHHQNVQLVKIVLFHQKVHNLPDNDFKSAVGAQLAQKVGEPSSS
jgi:hypothetical protein